MLLITAYPIVGELGSLIFFVLCQLTLAERDMAKLLLFHFLQFFQGFFYFDGFFLRFFWCRERSAHLNGVHSKQLIL